MAWAWFVIVELVQIFFAVLGWVILIPFCLAQAWDRGGHVSPDRWSWGPLNAIYGNPEDGVSGQQALIWDSSGHKVPYMPGAWAPWRAYCWSAWRNSSDQLKYFFAWQNGPLFTCQVFGRTFKAGWQQEALGKVPVLSL